MKMDGKLAFKTTIERTGISRTAGTDNLEGTQTGELRGETVT